MMKEDCEACRARGHRILLPRPRFRGLFPSLFFFPRFRRSFASLLPSRWSVIRVLMYLNWCISKNKHEVFFSAVCVSPLFVYPLGFTNADFWYAFRVGMLSINLHEYIILLFSSLLHSNIHWIAASVSNERPSSTTRSGVSTA